MRSILYTLTVSLLSSADVLQFVQAYSALPLIKNRCTIGILPSVIAGRRFLYQSAIPSSVSTLPVVESSKVSGEFSLGKPFSGLIADFKRRLPYYKSDWTDGFRKKSLAAILFLYFACLGKRLFLHSMQHYYNMMTKETSDVKHWDFSLECICLCSH